MPEIPNQMVTIHEATKRLKISRTSLYGLIKRGDIRTYKIGKRVLISELEISRFLSYCVVPPE